MNVNKIVATPGNRYLYMVPVSESSESELRLLVLL